MLCEALEKYFSNVKVCVYEVCWVFGRFLLLYFGCFWPRTNNSRSITYHKNNVQSPLEHTQSLHFTNIWQFFLCLNCIPPIKFTSTRARVLFTIYNSFPRESSQFIINFWFSWECHAIVKISVWSWNKKWLICILSRSSEHLRRRREFLMLAIPSSKRCFYVIAS